MTCGDECCQWVADSGGPKLKCQLGHVSLSIHTPPLLSLSEKNESSRTERGRKSNRSKVAEKLREVKSIPTETFIRRGDEGEKSQVNLQRKTTKKKKQSTV